MSAAEVLPMFEEEARKRQGQRTDLQPSGQKTGKSMEARDEAGPWYRDPRRRWAEWLPSDEPLVRWDQPAPTRNEIRDGARAACLAWGIDPDLAEMIAADAATAVAWSYVRWAEKGARIDTRPDNAIEGRARSRALASLGGTLRARGLEPDEITACLLAVNDSRCHPPLTDAEVAEIAVSFANKQAARPLAA